jgi:serine/threonine protein kinase
MAPRFHPLGPDDPTEIAGYPLRARLGSGGMGTVYLAFSSGGYPVAIKVVRPEFADDPEFRRRFKREVEAARRVHGTYTAQVVNADTDAAVPWLATTYIAGPSLQQAIGEDGHPLPVLSVFRLLAGAAEGIAAIHAVGLIHRDLKPSNVLLAADGPRVIDFGIVHAADASSLTSVGQVIGTPAFLAPEQINGQVTEATDVWALGHLAAYAATAHAVFGDSHVESVLIHRILNEPPQLEDCPAEIRSIAERCLAKNPAERPSVHDVIAFARNATEGQTMQLMGASWLPPSVDQTLSAYDARLAPPPPAPAPHLPAQPPAQPSGRAEPVRPVPAPRRPRRGVIIAAGLCAAVVLAGYLIFHAFQSPGPQTPTTGGATTAASSPAVTRSATVPAAASSSGPAASGSASPGPDSTGGYTALQTYPTDISMPGGTCYDTVAAFATDGPHVYTNVETLFNDSSKWDVTLSNCATPDDQEELAVNQGSALTDAVSPSSTPEECEKQISENPVGNEVAPAAGQTVCFETQHNILVLMTFSTVTQSPSYTLHAHVTAWSVASG